MIITNCRRCGMVSYKNETYCLNCGHKIETPITMDLNPNSWIYDKKNGWRKQREVRE